MYYNNLTLMTDFYQLTMIQGYYLTGNHSKKAVFDLFYRKNPDNGGFSIAAGLEQAIKYVTELRFTLEDISYLQELGVFHHDFLEYLREFRFTGDIHAIREGTVVFPREPLLRVTAPVMEAQFVETALLNIINHQSLIATKAARVKSAAGENSVMEFGLRRAQGPDAGLYGARAAIIGGADSTSNVLCAKLFGAPLSGTHAHSWIMSFPDEISAFSKYTEIYPDDFILLLDTYNTLESGLVNAIEVFSRQRAQGKLKKYGVRLDSGDLAYLSKRVRTALDNAGFNEAIITASGDLDEHLITSLKHQGAKIDAWGVGTNLITSRDCPAFGGVYKLAAEENTAGEMVPKMKISDNPEKITNPGEKTVFRLYDKKTGRVKADLISLADETIDETRDLTIFHPVETWKKMTLRAGEYLSKNLLEPVILGGKVVYDFPEIIEIRDYCRRDLESFWEEHLRLVNPHILPVDLSVKLYGLREKMIRELKP